MPGSSASPTTTSDASSSFLEEIGELDNTLFMLISDNGASSEGGPVGSLNEMMFFNNVPESIEENLDTDRRAGRPERLQPLRMGLDERRQHAVPPLEAGDLSRRHHRPVHRLVARRHHGARRDPHAVRAHHRHGADRAGGARLATRRRAIRGVTQAPDRRRELRPHLRRGGFAEPITTPSTSRCSATARSTTTAGARSAHGRGRASPRPRRRAATTAAPSRQRCWPTSRPTTGSCTDLTTDYAETRNLAGEHRDKLIEMIGRWWAEAGKYHVMPIDGSMLERMNVERPTIARPRDSYVYYPGGSPVPFSAAPKVYNRPFSITADVQIPDRRCRGRPAGPRRSRRRLHHVRQGR